MDMNETLYDIEDRTGLSMSSPRKSKGKGKAKAKRRTRGAADDDAEMDSSDGELNELQVFIAKRKRIVAAAAQVGPGPWDVNARSFDGN